MGSQTSKNCLFLAEFQWVQQSAIPRIFWISRWFNIYLANCGEASNFNQKKELAIGMPYKVLIKFNKYILQDKIWFDDH